VLSDFHSAFVCLCRNSHISHIKVIKVFSKILCFVLFVPFCGCLSIFAFQADLLRKHYEAANAYHRSGNYAAAEAEFKVILGEAYERLAKIYSAQNNYQASIVAFESGRAMRPNSTDGLVELAIAYFHAGQYAKGIEPLQRVIAADAKNAIAHHMLGKTYFMMGEFDKASSELQETLRLTPGDYDAEYTLGLCYLKRKDVAGAKQLYGRMVERLGDRPALRVLIGRAYRETGFLPESIEEFKKAIELDPKFPRVHYYLGLTYLFKDGAARIPEAVEEFKIELSANPEEYFANFYLGILYIMERKFEPAIALLEKAVSKQPNNPDPYFHLGQAYQGAGRHADAVKVLQKTITLNPTLAHNDYQVTTAHYRLGQSLLKVGRTEEGQKELQISADLKAKGFKLDEKRVGAFLSGNAPDHSGKDLVKAEGVIAEAAPLDPQKAEKLKAEETYYSKVIAAGHNSIGLLRAEQQDFREASAQFALAAKWNPNQEGLNFNLGLAYYKSESYKEAIPALENELKIDPSNIAIKQLLGLSYFMTNDYAKAAALLTDVIAVKSQDAALHYPLALSLLKDGKLEAANRVIEQMVTVGGNSPQLHILLSQAHYERGEVDKALEELRTALSLDDKVRLAHFYTGLIHLKAGIFPDAAREFQLELSVNPNDFQAKYHLAFVVLAQQETERGINMMRDLVREQPDFADARYELGKALLQKGDVKGSIENLETAARLKPEQPHVHYQLGRAYIAAGRRAEGESQLEISKQLKEKARSNN
jgi:tetratricopeptide (TPR) repeat protein